MGTMGKMHNRDTSEGTPISGCYMRKYIRNIDQKPGGDA